MGDFIEIKTQEEFEKRLKDRLERAEKTAAERVKTEYAPQLQELAELKEAKKKWDELESGYKSKADEHTTSISDLTSKLQESQAKVKRLEQNEARQKIADELGLPASLAARIKGDTEEEMKEDAKSLASIFKASNIKDLPMANLDTEEVHQDKTTKAFKGMLKELTEGDQ